MPFYIYIILQHCSFFNLKLFLLFASHIGLECLYITYYTNLTCTSAVTVDIRDFV